METKAPSPNLNIEQRPSSYQPNIEGSPSTNNPEVGIENGPEAYDKKSEINALVSDVGLTTVLPPPVIVSGVATDDAVTTNSTNISDSPIVANDDDLIEKEWVDKAKKIVAETRDNPYQRDEEVSKLQIDYLKKRFGRELGAAK